jgi:hypothetical protein
MQVAGFGQAHHVVAVHTTEHTGGGYFARYVVADILVLEFLFEFKGINQGFIGHREQSIRQGVLQ